MAGIFFFFDGIAVRRTTAKPLVHTLVPTSLFSAVPAPTRLFSRSRPSYRLVHSSSSPTRIINHTRDAYSPRSGPSISSLSSPGSVLGSTTRLQSRLFSTTSTTMAKKDFVVIVPDKAGAQPKRLEVRPTHIEGIKPLIANGTLLDGGAIFHEHPAEGEAPKFKGSALILQAESVDEIKELLKKDIYASEGVWDLENAHIFPFKSALRG